MCRTTETANRRCFVRYNKPHQTPKTPYTKHQMAVTALTPSTILSTFLSPFSYHRFEHIFSMCRTTETANRRCFVRYNKPHQTPKTPNTKWQLLPLTPSTILSTLLPHITDLSKTHTKKKKKKKKKKKNSFLLSHIPT